MPSPQPSPTASSHAGPAAAARLEEGRPFVVAVLPVYNCDRMIGSALLKLRRFVDAAVVVNDGSTDATGVVARQAGAEVIEYLTRQAPGVALEHGLARALDLGADVVVIVEGEAQLIPEQAPLVLQPILDGGADMVLGVPLRRVRPSRPRRWLAQRRPAASDPGICLRAFTASALAASGVFSPGFLGDRKVKAATSGQGLRSLEVPISQVAEERPSRPALPRLRSDLVYRFLTMDSALRLLIALGLAGLLLNVAGIYFWYETVQIFETRHALALGHALIGTLAILVGVMVAFEAITLNILRRLVNAGGGTGYR